MSSLTRSWLRCCCVLFWAAGCALHTRPVEAGDPSPLTAEQSEKLKERDRLVTEVHRLQREGKLVAAIAAAEKMLLIERQVYGDVHEEIADSLASLAAMHQRREDFTAARKARQEALALRIKLHGETHWKVTDSRLFLADVDLLAKMTPEQRRKVREADALFGLVSRLKELGLAWKALPLAESGLEINQSVFGVGHPRSGYAHNEIGFLYDSMGDYAKAKPSYQKAREIAEQALGEKHPSYAAILNNLAELYKSMGDYAEAEPFYQKAIEIKKAALGEKHPAYATSLNNLAELYRSMGDYARAEPLYRNAMEIDKRTLGERHPSYAIDLNNLALLYQSMGDYAKAAPLAQKALEIRRQALGAKHPDYAQSLNNLAGLYQSMGDLARAELLYQAALKIRKQSLGENHPLYATTLNNLAGLYKSMGDYTKAEPLYQEAVTIRKGLSEKHPSYAESLNNLSRMYHSMGDFAKALPPCRQALAISRDNLDLTAAVQSERQQLALLGDLRYVLDNHLSLANEVKQPLEQQYEPVLVWKGAVSLRQGHQRLARRHPELAKDFADLDRTAAHLATVALAVPDPKRLEAHRRQIQDLTVEKERLETKLARRSSDFRKAKELQRLTPSQLQAVLPKETALLDFLEYSHETPSAEKKGKGHWEYWLVVFVVRHHSLVRVDLGPVKPIKVAIDRWRLALQRRFRTEGDAQLGAEVRKLVWQKLEDHLQGAKVVLISPDGLLSRLPFAALPGSKKDSYLLEELTLAVVPVPQLLPELLAPRPEENRTEPSLLLVGDVRYDSITTAAAVADSRTASRAGTLLSWKALANTRAEVAAIKDSFQRRFRRAVVTDLREDEASEAELRKQAPRHHYLHFATHGYFAPKELRSALTDVARAKDGEVGNLFGGRGGVAGFHPALLSGLVLAGANRPAELGKDDGILTAMEVQALDLAAVELATLSACETGLGEQAGGEGLLGLQRAFQLAGARSAVAGLWQVDDAATRQLMVKFYENLWQKKLSKLEALRQAQLWMLKYGDGWMRKEGVSRGMIDVKVPRERLAKEDGRLPPYYWAAFVLSGDWR